MCPRITRCPSRLAAASAAPGRNRPPACPERQSSVLLVDRAADGFGARLRDGLAGEDGVECVAQIGYGSGRALLSKIHHAIIDPSEIEHLTIGREDRGLRSHGRTGEVYQRMARIQQ